MKLVIEGRAGGLPQRLTPGRCVLMVPSSDMEECLFVGDREAPGGEHIFVQIIASSDLDSEPFPTMTTLRGKKVRVTIQTISEVKCTSCDGSKRTHLGSTVNQIPVFSGTKPCVDCKGTGVVEVVYEDPR